MPRAPCCEKIGLKKGPWTAEEDQILIDYVREYGHANWRALPKEAGLSRCGKSCRLRWINYLRPDIKRGNFSPEEEDVIINLHQLLGNRWSAIAAKLPGRTDNEIKNVWHTHLKKKASKNLICASKEEVNPNPICSESSGSSDLSSVTADSSYSEANNICTKSEIEDTFESFPEMGDSFWAEALDINNSSSNCSSSYDVSMTLANIDDELMDNNVEPACSWSDQDMDFWYQVFLGTDNL